MSIGNKWRITIFTMFFTIPIVSSLSRESPSIAGWLLYSYRFFGHNDHSQKVVDICVFHLMISVIVDTADDDDVNGWICFIDHGLIDLQLWSYFLDNDDDIVYWWLSTTIVRVWDEKKPEKSQMNFWWISDESQMNLRWISDDLRWVSDESQMNLRWVSDESRMKHRWNSNETWTKLRVQ